MPRSPRTLSRIVAAILCTSAFGAAPREPTLEPGRSVERVLSPGESHAYRIVCPAGSYAQVVVEQRGVDVVVSVSGPDGKELLEVDTPTEPSGREGSESVPFVAARAGAYRLRVRAGAADAQGAYAVRIDERHPATPTDRVRAQAHQLWAQGNRAVSRGTADGLRQALQAYQETGRLLQDLGDDDDAARVLKQAGDLAVALGEAATSVDLYGRALAKASRLRRLAGQAHLGLGNGRRSLGAPAQARDHYQQALAIFESLADGRGRGAALAGLAATHWEDLGDADSAFTVLAEALELSRSSNDGRLERAVLHNIASIHDWSGDKQQALALYQKALDLERAAGDRLATAMTLNEVGHLFAQWGDYARARDAHNEALDLARALGNRQQEAWGLIHVGRMHSLLGDLESARASLDAALALSRQIGEATLEAHALSRLGETYRIQGNTSRARECLQAAVAAYRGSALKYWPASALVQLGAAHREAGDLAAARAALGEALDLARSADAPGIEAAARRELARVALQLGDAEAASREATSAATIVESQRVQIAREDLRTSYSASVHPYFQTHVDALMALHRAQPGAGHAGAAFRVSERARARRVLEALVEAAVDVKAAVDPELVERERRLRRELSATASRQARLAEAGASAERRSLMERKLRQLEADRHETVQQLKRSSPRYAALVQPPILEPEEIQKELAPGTALLEYALGEDRSYVWMLTSNTIAARELPAGRTIDALAQRLSKALSARGAEAPNAGMRERLWVAADRTAADAAAALGRMVLPESFDFRGLERIVIVADGALQSVPFATLPVPAGAAGRPATLLARFDLVYAPSASWVATLRRLRAGAAAPRKALAVFADPVFDSLDSRVSRNQGTPEAPNATLQRATSEVGLRSSGSGAPPRLPYSRREALAVASMVQKPGVLLALDFDASRERATSPDLADYRVLHFATHSLQNGAHPDLSGIVLSLVDRKGRDQDGFLRVQDVYNLRLPAELVVLSGCQTAAGRAVPGEGPMGLARGFMYAGARRVVASLWPVDEAPTAQLMTVFYRELRKGRRGPAQALRRAQLALAAEARWRAPYYWAGFVIQGDWSDSTL